MVTIKKPKTKSRKIISMATIFSRNILSKGLAKPVPNGSSRKRPLTAKDFKHILRLNALNVRRIIREKNCRLRLIQDLRRPSLNTVLRLRAGIELWNMLMTIFRL
jgi:hypothetical protein